MLNIYCKMRISQLNKKEDFSITKYYSNAMKNMVHSSTDGPKCRVCLQKGSIYILDNDKSDILEALQIFGNIHLSEDDEYPKHLCKVCNKFIRDAILFRNTAVKAYNILKSKFKKKSPSIGPDSDDNDFSDTINDSKKAPDVQNISHAQNMDIEKGKKQPPKYKAKLVPCPICNKFYFKSYIDEHITIHEVNNKRHVCDECGKTFRLKSSYRNHMLTHRKEFPYSCKFCPYKAKNVELVKLHTRVHIRDYKYMCTECPSKFIAKSNLNRHMLSHRDPQFKCDSCTKAFYTKAILRSHYEAIHLGMKKYICNLCDKAFGYRYLMMRHQRHFHKREKMSSSRVPAYLQAESGNM